MVLLAVFKNTDTFHFMHDHILPSYYRSSGEEVIVNEETCKMNLIAAMAVIIPVFGDIILHLNSFLCVQGKQVLMNLVKRLFLC